LKYISTFIYRLRGRDLETEAKDKGRLYINKLIDEQKSKKDANVSSPSTPTSTMTYGIFNFNKNLI
jgi:hypothetical protein